MGTICVIGAGVAGLTCATRLREAGQSVIVLEKSRGIGGRLATRRTDGGPTFDHGAQYLTARHPAFARFLENCVSEGTAARWSLKGDSKDERSPRFVGVSRMPDLFRANAETLDIRFGTSAVGVTSGTDGWRLQGDGAFDFGAHEFSHVLSTAPAEQSVALLGDACSFREDMVGADYHACMAAMIGFADRVPVDVDCARDVSERIAWLARNSTKPKRDFGGDQWVVHAPPAWSAQHLNSEKDDIACDLFSAFQDWVGEPLPEPDWLMGHRWKYAQVRTPVGQACLYDADTGLGAAGDWCVGPRVEAAFDSGLALADRVIAHTV